ncbi:hypothetical protein IE077_001266 [Cardiosporidium cionae]|uniref:EF-hand domain-containing protein n=1 Tax=Cardiosporidium cionae TaxID=476202 RepID=A0ABQ7JDC9_9APIC|nr:hypothetical protein IE077_001266 [Cardiosporidium cionae]|eukprot:KAF8821981.1 hypothetical protein IE077_001266 [Cardiosporidium cionae]
MGIHEPECCWKKREKAEKDCDIATFGPAKCAISSEAEENLTELETRRYNASLILCLAILFLGIGAQSLVKFIEIKVLQNKDEFSRGVFETASRQVAIISVIIVVMWGILQTKIAENMDEALFGDIIQPEAKGNQLLHVEPLLEVLFEEFFFMMLTLLLWYIGYVFLIHIIVNRLINWIQKADDESIDEIIAELETTKNSICSTLWKDTFWKANFIAHRPTFHFRLKKEVALICALSAACLALMLIVRIVAQNIEKNIRPRQVTQYISLRSQMQHEQGIEESNLLSTFAPPYKWHKQLASCFFQLVVLALWTNLMRTHVHTWFYAAPWGISVVTGMFCLQSLCLSGSLYLVLLSLHAGMLTDVRLLEKSIFRARNIPSEEKNSVLIIWANLDEEQLGEIDRSKIYRFLLSQGLHLRQEKDADYFLQIFDRTSKGGLNKDEFFILFSVVQQLLQEPLDKETLQDWLEETCKKSGKIGMYIQLPELTRILSTLGLDWKNSRKTEFISFICGSNAQYSITPELFSSQMLAIEKHLLQPIQQ